MMFVSKAAFFILFGINSLLVLFSFFSFINLLLDPYKKLSEGIILLLGGIIVGIGLYLAFRYGYATTDFTKGVVILVSAFVIALVWIIIGLLFFNGPLHWQ
jgi:hypothetical protein